jgi:hypothetical protein
LYIFDHHSDAMGQIEELPDDYDEPNPSLVSNNNTPFPIKPDVIHNDDALAPELPPAMASIRSYTPDQLADMLNKTPLFMTDLENAGDERASPPSSILTQLTPGLAEGENVMLDAIRAMQYEGTRGEVALSFREQGNEAAKARNWVDAKEFYTKAIAVLNVRKADDKWEAPADMAAEEKMLREAREASYANRALCNLELST